MRTVKFLFSICTIFLILFTCSCVKEESVFDLKTSPSDKRLVDLASKVYEDPQLLEIVDFNGSIKELDVEYPIECLRNKNDTYRVSYLGNSGVAVIMFDNSGNKILGNVFNTHTSKIDFDVLAKGQSLEKVREIDPDGEYLFLYTGRADVPRVSSHYTKDGYLITIEYDSLNNITAISEELI